MDPSKHAPLKINDIRTKYKVIDKVGKGTYGTVFKVLNLQDNKYYAIKKFENTDTKLQVQGFPITALRQISLLKQFNHPHIVNLKQIICSKPNRRNLFRGSTFMVFDYMHHDFAGLFRSKIKFSPSEIKCIMKQILQGCCFLHQNKVMHRDIKSANILMDDRGIVQLADFGLGRRTRFDNVYTYKVVTLWYRAPQLLLGCKTYNHKVDVWSIGCVLAEFLAGQVLFKKETQYAIIQKIYQICGDLESNQFTEQYLRGCVYYHDMRPKKPVKNSLASYMRKLCPTIDSTTIDFLQGLLQLNPYKRLSCQEALNHQYFKKEPIPCTPQQIHKLDVEYHEMFKDRSLKIQRKERKESLDWSQQQERKKQKEIANGNYDKKNYNYDQRENKNPTKYEQRYPEKKHDREYQLNKHDRYQVRRQDYKKYQYQSYKKYDDYKTRRRYSRSYSESSSSSSSSGSRHSRSRNRKYYQNKQHKQRGYRKQDYYERRSNSPRKKENNGHHTQKYYKQSRERYGQRQRSNYNGNKPYEPRVQIRGRDYPDDHRRQQSRIYKQRNYDYKFKQKRQSQYLQMKDQNQTYEKEKYQKDQYGKKYPIVSIKQKYSDEGKPHHYKNQKQLGQYKSRYQDRKYQDKYQFDGYSKNYTSRQSRQNPRKQYYQSSQKYYEERKPHKQKERQYRQYDKSSYEYQRKQSRNKDDLRYRDQSRYREDSRSKENQPRKFWNQNRQSIQRKKYSPNKKKIQMQDY